MVHPTLVASFVSSINPHPTFEYSQPEEYRFSHDSVFMARRVYEQTELADLAGKRILDLCAGCGIIGMDFLFHLRKDQKSLPVGCDFLEVQAIYREHFEENRRRLGPIETEMKFLDQNYDVLSFREHAESYDLILSNPPYFLPQYGSLSPSEFKNRCRFFIDSDFSKLILGVCNALKKTGTAYILLRDLSAHQWDVLAETKRLCQDRIEIQVLGDIRGTYFVSLRHRGI